MQRLFLVIFLLINTVAWSQDVRRDEITIEAARRQVIQNSWLQCYAKGWFFLQKERIQKGQEQIFYAILLALLFFGILKVVYARYTADMFRFYFQSTLRIQQVKEQLSHSVISGFYYNILFFFVLSVYLYLLADYYNLSFLVNQYYLLFVLLGLLAFIYCFKFLFIQLLGWSFQQTKAGSMYLFIIFLTNKIMGLALLPFSICIAFGTPLIKDYAVTISISLVLSLFTFRFFRAYQPLRAEFKVGVFQYMILLISVELAPLLLIYKLLLQYL